MCGGTLCPPLFDFSFILFFYLFNVLLISKIIKKNKKYNKIKIKNVRDIGSPTRTHCSLTSSLSQGTHPHCSPTFSLSHTWESGKVGEQ